MKVRLDITALIVTLQLSTQEMVEIVNRKIEMSDFRECRRRRYVLKCSVLDT